MGTWTLYVTSSQSCAKPRTYRRSVSFASRSARASFSILRWRGFWADWSSCSTRLQERRKLSRCRCLAAWSGESACFISAKVGVASACCSSTDLLSQPRAIHKLYAECRVQPLVRPVPAKKQGRGELRNSWSAAQRFPGRDWHDTCLCEPKWHA